MWARPYAWVVHLGAAWPVAWTGWQFLTARLGPDPVGTITRRGGRAALVFLLLSLVPGAVQRVASCRVLLALRRPLGLYAFGYAALHLVSHVALGYGLQMGLFVDSLAQERFVLIGLASFGLLAPLALTSTHRWQQRLGRRWAQLHRLVYLAAALAVWHYGWAFKEWRRAPLAAALVLVLLLLPRLWRSGRSAKA